VEGIVEEGNVFAIELGVTVPGRAYEGREEEMLVRALGSDYVCQPQVAR
jgi:hypothetical protein